MTPDRARSILVEYVRVDSEKGDSTPLQRMAVVVQAILAACAEERRAALTEAATVVCCDVAKYGSMEHTCRGNVLALRDREPR